MEHHVKHVLMEATVLEEQQSVLSVQSDISKCNNKLVNQFLAAADIFQCGKIHVLLHVFVFVG